ncbi:MAG: hypothetical protein E6H91_12315 [Chloroflexi bacterium]|nr:MAG: hypothetical protein E6H91_12315 [Chloroflexota bacterium]
MISDDELRAIKRRCDAATPGPWRASMEGRDHTSGDSFIRRGNAGRESDLYLTSTTAGGTEIPSAADHEFIATARQDIPRLLDEIARLRGRPI